MLSRLMITVLVSLLPVSAALANSQLKDVSVSEFDEFVVKGHGLIEIIQSDAVGLQLEADEKLLERVEVNQSKNRVSIQIKDEKRGFIKLMKSDDPVVIKVRMKTVRHLGFSGDVKASAKTLEGTALTVNLHGASEIHVGTLSFVEAKADISGASTMVVENFDIEEPSFGVSGASRLKVSGVGHAKQLRANVSGASRVDAAQLSVEQANLDVSGASGVELSVNQHLIANVSGASNVGYLGAPSTQLSVSGASHVKSLQR